MIVASRASIVFAVALAVLGATEVVGNVTSSITLNFWLRDFAPHQSSVVVVNLISAVFYVVLFVPWSIVTIVKDIRTHGAGRVRRLCRRKHLQNGCFIAVADTWVNIASTFAAGRTPVITQIFARSTEPIMTFVLSTVVLQDHRRCSESWVPYIAFACIIGAVVLHMYPEMRQHNASAAAADDDDAWMGIPLLFSGVLASSLYGIAQARFMRIGYAEFSTRPEASDQENPHLLTAADDVPPSALVRSLALSVDCTVTLLLTVALVPLMDTIPKLGDASTVRDVWRHAALGFDSLFQCRSNMLFGAVTCAGWAAVYVADTYLNHFSPSLNAMIAEFTAPVGVIVLLMVPSWALGSAPQSSSEAALLRNVVSTSLLCCGAVIFARHEAATGHHKAAIPSLNVASPAAPDTTEDA